MSTTFLFCLFTTFKKEINKRMKEISRVKFLRIDKDTPYDVILFLLKTTGKNIEREKIEKKFEKIKTHLLNYTINFEMKDEYSEKEISDMTCFITDKEEPWSVQNLLISIKDFLTFQESPTLEIPCYGSRDNTSPNSFDISMLYRLCLELSLETEKEDTIETLYQKVKSVNSSKRELQEEIKKKLLHFNEFQLIKINKFSVNKEPFHFKKENLENLSAKINMGYIIKNSILSEEEAIIYASKFFNTDITESQHPDVLLKYLSSSDLDNYPHKDEFHRKYRLNPKFCKLDKFWKPELKHLYTPKSLQSIKVFLDVDTEEKLNLSLEKDNFYEGVLDFDKEETNEEEVVSFGNFKDNKFKVYKVSDLVQKFKDELYFGNYHTTIDKLLTIAKDNSYEDLEIIIKYIRKYCHIITPSIIYCKKNGEARLERYFEQLNELSGILKDKQEISELDNMSFVNTLEEIIKTFNSISEDELKREIEKLPILNYKAGKFAKANENYYENIHEDIKSLKNIKGKSEEFIRMKYQQYSYTSYYYTYLFFGKRLFEINAD